jgi:biopolymer transport protein TolQ
MRDTVRRVALLMLLGSMLTPLTMTASVAAAQTKTAAPQAKAAPTKIAQATQGTAATAAQPTAAPVESAESAQEIELANQSIFGRALQGGFVVFSCLMILVLMSVATWAIVIAKYVHLMRVGKTSDSFIKSFWDSRSLNDLNGRLGEYPYSPVREVFRSGYAELVRGSQLRDQAATSEIAINAALDNLNRALGKAKMFERRRMERFMSVLAISASASPFIGLFGTVWGIMGAFEGIARTGSASLAAVAPGISEALIATAFGLAAAIPAVVGYNVFASRVRGMLANIDGFSADFLNIVERYLVTDKPRGTAGGGGQHAPLSERI